MARLVYSDESDLYLLFQHMPRSGGTWIEEAIASCNLKWITWAKVPTRVLPISHSYIGHYYKNPLSRINGVVGFVRHPVAYYEGVWKWMATRKPDKLAITKDRWKWHPHKTAVQNYVPDFNDWVFLMLEKDPMWATRLYEGFMGPEGGEFCDYIGRTETLCWDFFRISQMFGFWKDVKPHRQRLKFKGKVNSSGEIEVKWDDGLKDRVLRSEKLAINRFYSRNTKNKRIYTRNPKLLKWAEDGKIS